jgi:hypothetical protein
MAEDACTASLKYNVTVPEVKVVVALQSNVGLMVSKSLTVKAYEEPLIEAVPRLLVVASLTKPDGISTYNFCPIFKSFARGMVTLRRSMVTVE